MERTEKKKKYCILCKKTFSKTNNYTRHMRNKHNTQLFIQMYPCLEGECAKKNRLFKFTKNLRAHLRNNHNFADERINAIIERTEVVLSPNNCMFYIHESKK